MSAPLPETMDWSKDGGLLPLIVQHAHDARVLMVGYANREALARTLETGEVHFWSRSKQRIWCKGESSGHFLRVREIRVDCDQDALVMLVEPEGPACHTGARSCFYRRLVDDRLEPVEQP